jgi:hypothetical protein
MHNWIKKDQREREREREINERWILHTYIRTTDYGKPASPASSLISSSLD